jgi:transcriptional regulator with XRE-family HTH domain
MTTESMTTPKKTRTAKGPRRPKRYRPRAAERVSELICQGYTLREIAARAGMPTLSTLQHWYSENETFRAYYVRVRQFQREVLADDIMAIADAFNVIDRADRKVSIDARESRIDQINKTHPEAAGAAAFNAHETLERLQRALERVRKREAAAIPAPQNLSSAESASDSDSPEGDR